MQFIEKQAMRNHQFLRPSASPPPPHLKKMATIFFTSWTAQSVYIPKVIRVTVNVN